MTRKRFELVDVSAETFGKYQFCTMSKKDGMYYADSDFDLYGKLKRGALPAPDCQPTPQLTARAREMHEAAATAAVSGVLSRAKAKTKTRTNFFPLIFGLCMLTLCCSVLALLMVGR